MQACIEKRNKNKVGLSNNQVYCTFDGKTDVSLPMLVRNLLARQQMTWPQLKVGYAALLELRIRHLEVGERTISLQCNPRRIVSTGADINPVAIQARACFLCSSNLPPMQQGVLCHRQWMVLCNPFPIFPQHFTVAHVQHRPQSVNDAWPSLLQLTRDFQPDFALLYNGPQCGASAPDHLHFQAVPKKAIPALNGGREKMKQVWQRGGLALLRTTSDPLAAFLLEGSAYEELIACLASLTNAMQSILPSAGEPLLNLFCHYEEGRWHIMVFPRRQHRPKAYYQSGQEQILLSPGAVDMGGLLVLPREADYNRLDSKILFDIFKEISISEDLLAKIVAVL